MNKPIEAFARTYNAQLLSNIRDYRNALHQIAGKFPVLRFTFHYVTCGDTTEIHPKLPGRVDVLRRNIDNLFYGADFSFDFIGARELVDISRREMVHPYRLDVQSFFYSGENGIVCLMKLKDYYKFITDEQGKRIQAIFDANVRDYEGEVDVNEAIRNTLSQENNEIDFWWLNNGITIVASTISPIIGGNFILEDPKVVNGLQTSQEVFRHFSGANLNSEKLLLVRVIKTENEAVRNAILKATNSQTRIPQATLRAIDPIHKDIEDFFSYNGFFYDRQRNFYKNQGKPKDKIITILYLAQAMVAVILQEPNNSRARPTTVIEDPERYKMIFNPEYPLIIYLNCIKFMKKIDEFFRVNAPDYAKKEKVNIRYQLAMFVAAVKTRSVRMTVERFLSIDLDEIDTQFIMQCLSHVWEIYVHLINYRNEGGDTISKNRQFDEMLLAYVAEIDEGGIEMG